ncbi:MAG: multidrug effflux MFS transporter [Legionellaceae bacterium]|nr:multidrug effflux MFS transporter [Legionellaceae bacterium]
MKKLTIASILILIPCIIFQPMGMDIFISALPAMISSLKVNTEQVQLLIISFMLASSIPQLIMGNLSDHIGRRPVILIATIGYCIASYLCATASSIYWLVAIRFIHGICAATSLVIVFAIVRDIFDDVQSAKMYSHINSILAITAMLSPLFGAYLIKYFHNWESTFNFLSIFAATTLLVLFFSLPETSSLRNRKSRENNILHWVSLKKILMMRVFWTYVMCVAMGMTGLFLYFLIGSVLFLKILKVSSYHYALFFCMNATFYLFGSFASSFLLSRIRIIHIVLIGNIFVFISSITMLIANLFLELSVIHLVVFCATITFGYGIIIGPATGAALAPFKDSAGTAAGVLTAAQYGVPAIIGFVVTRFKITSTLSSGGPLFIFCLINFYLLLKLLKKER